MTIRFLAQELYRLTQRVEELKHAVAALDDASSLEERMRLETALAQARKELEHYRSVLDSKKEKPSI